VTEKSPVSAAAEKYKKDLLALAPRQEVLDSNLKSAGPPEPEMGALGSFIDFVSRPLYAVTNIADKALDLPARFSEGEAFQGLGALAASPVTGFLSKSRDNKNYTSDLIEKSSDVFNKGRKGYVDVKDNVDPVFKGVAGFAGDVVLDPLSWVPGAQVVKGINLGLRGVRAATALGKKVIPKSKTAKEVLEDTVGLEKAPTNKPGSFEDAAENITTPAQAEMKFSDRVKDSIKKGLLPEDAVSSSMRTTINKSKVDKTTLSRRNQMDTYLKEWSTGKLPTDLPTVGTKLGYKDWIKQLNGLDGAAASLVKIPEQVGGVAIPGGTLQGLREVLEGATSENYDQLFQAAEDTILKPLHIQFSQGFDADPLVDMLGRSQRTTTPTDLAQGALNTVARIARLANTELANAEQIFTKPLMASMRAMGPEEMAKFLDNSQYVLRRKGLVEGMGKITGNSAERNLLKAFNIPLPTYRTALKNLTDRVDSILEGNPPIPVAAAVEGLSEDAVFLAELTARFEPFGFNNPQLVQDSATAISRALVSMIKKNFDVDELKKLGYVSELRANGEILITKDGIARISNSYNTYAQNDFYTELSKEFRVLFGGVPSRNNAGKIISNRVKGPDGTRTVYDYETLPIYFKAGEGGTAYNALKGYELTTNVQNSTMAALKTAEDFLVSLGMPIVLDVSTASAGRVVAPLRYSDVIESLRMGFTQSGIPNSARWLQLALFHPGTGVSRTHLMDAVMSSMSGATKEDIVKILVSGKTRYGKDLPKGANWLSGASTDSKFGFYPLGKKLPKEEGGFKTEAKIDPSTKDITGHYGVWNNKALADKLADAILASRNALENISNIRKEQYLARGITEFQAISPQIAAKFVSMFKDEKNAKAAIIAVNNIGSVVLDYVEALKATDLAAVYIAGALRSVIPQSIRNMAKSTSDFEKAIKVGDDKLLDARQKAAASNAKDFEKNYKEGINAANEVKSNPKLYDEATQEAADVVEEVDIAGPGVKEQGYGTVSMMAVRVASAFNAKWGMDVKNHLSAFLEFESIGVVTSNYVGKLRGLEKLRLKHPNLADGTNPMLGTAMREIQKAMRRGEAIPDEVIQSNPALARAINDLREEIGLVYNVKSDLVKSALNTAFGRAGLPLAALNKYFARQAVLGRVGGKARIPESGQFIDEDLARQVSSDTGIDPLSAGLNQWIDWDIEDPIDFLKRSHAAVHQMATESSFVDSFISSMRSRNLYTDNAAVATSKGFVRLSGGKGSHFGALIPKDMYVDKNIASIFQKMDEAMRPSEFLQSELGTAMRGSFDVILNRWKTTVTILRPGHHIRNEIGSLSMRFFALGQKGFLAADTLAYRQLKLRNNYDGADLLNAMDEMTNSRNNSTPKESEIVIRTKLGNMTSKQLDDDFYKYIAIEGTKAEDLLGGDLLKTRFSKGVDTFFTAATLGAGKRGGIVEQKALELSWFIHHKNIYAHYIQAITQLGEATAKKPWVRSLTETVVPKNMAEVRALALETALKNHPTPGQLSAWEKVFGRRLFPFYTWIKLASVALAESTILNPARTATLIPKASYNLAIAMGTDPYSMYSPFPTDQEFPSFFEEEATGPQAKWGSRYIGISPGFANIDIYNTFSAGPLQAALELSNPLLRIPIELLAGSRLSTQAPIGDISDYIDSSIPGVNYISSISGRSVTGLGALQSQVERGNKTSFDQKMGAFNWLTGLSAKNYSRPNYINFAEIEERNRIAEEEKKSTGFLGFLGF
jgi:hypothetical protein